MTPKEKAEELLIKFNYYYNDDYKEYLICQSLEESKRCALIAVDEIFEFMRMDDEYTDTVSNANSKWVSYWNQVKQEIEKL